MVKFLMLGLVLVDGYLVMSCCLCEFLVAGGLYVVCYFHVCPPVSERGGNGRYEREASRDCI